MTDLAHGRTGAPPLREGRIAAMGDRAAQPGEPAMHSAGCAVTPRLVNSHHRLPPGPDRRRAAALG